MPFKTLTLLLFFTFCLLGPAGCKKRHSPQKSAAPEEAVGQGAGFEDAQKSQSSRIAVMTEEQLLKSLGEGEEKNKVFCGLPQRGTNTFIQNFCNPANKRPTSLNEVYGFAGLDLKDLGQDTSATGFAFLAHTTSLSTRSVSPLNPRVIIFPKINLSRTNKTPKEPATFVGVGYSRGEQLVELIAQDSDGSLRFYALKYLQACNASAEGCKAGDLLTPATETDWQGVTIYSDEDLKNTVLDCRQCHTFNGKPVLRMQELAKPWTHFLGSGRATNANNQELIKKFQAAHGTKEVYGAIAGDVIPKSDPAGLEQFIRGNGFGEPNENLFLESMENNRDGWLSLYNLVLKGEHFAAPFYGPDISDGTKFEFFAKQYQEYLNGQKKAGDLPDFRNVVADSPEVLADLGFGVLDTHTPEQILMLACHSCHQANGDPSLSRSHFKVGYNMSYTVDQVEKAINRLKMGYSHNRRKQENIEYVDLAEKPITADVVDHVRIMPPGRFKRLTDGQIDRLIQFLNEKKLTPPKN